EYQAPKTVDEFAVTQRRQQFIAAVKSVFALKNDNKIIMKTRKKQKGLAQYEKMDQQQHFVSVQEGGIKALVNLTDYLDTGLFLDHRPIRRYIAQHAEGKAFLNLFAYTSVATLHAAAGGATSSLSVDMSKTYQSWSQRNFRTNGLEANKHRLLNVNVMDFIKTSRESFDLIFLDPPSFSNSKKMRGSFDIQRDHRFLIEQTMKRLNEGGTLIFSNNRRGFMLDDLITDRYKVVEFHQQSIDPDFAKRANIHNCWLIQH
ncbi:MAG: class I SAM-dependent methyltransferase, partial [Cellvibrionales bacterium]|nr:class I SAM-dependent methyltransferase [Cellvibrionales bacterium]